MGWRENNAPYGLQQLAKRLNISVEQLLSRPDIVASAVGLMEGGKAGARHVAETFMNFVDRNGGGREGVLRAAPHYDTLVMASPQNIGNLQYAQNATIARLNREDLRPTFEHLNAVKAGGAAPLVDPNATKNFSAPYAGIPGGGRNYRQVQAPDGSVHTVPYWATDAIRSGKFTRSPSGEYLVAENGQRPFDVAWSRPAAPPTNVAATRPEGAMALGAQPPPPEPPQPAYTPPGPVESQPLPPVSVTAPPPPVWTGEGDSAPPPAPPTQPPPMQPDKWDAIQQQAIKAQEGFDDNKWDNVRQQAVNNQAQIGNGGFFGNPMFKNAGDFFRGLDGSGFKSGGAVKASKDQAKYRGHPNRGDKCRDCTMFTAPHGCTAVRGAISPYGWCSYFEATPTAVALAIKKAATQVERNPTELQKEWGNYSMGHFNWKGLEITLENPKGSIRRGKGWEVKMPAGYGYIKRTVGRDLDHVDVYVGDDHASDKVWVIDQVDAATGQFDEHKCMLSFKSQAQAVATYNKGFSDGKGPDRMGAITEKSVAEFLQWLEKGDTKKPMGKIQRRKSANVIPNTRVDASLETARKYSWGR